MAPLVTPLIWGYRILDRVFGLKRRGAKANLRRLLNEVRKDHGFLLEKLGGQIVDEESEGSPSFDQATVVIRIQSIKVRATRDRGFTDWYVTPGYQPNDWLPLMGVLKQLGFWQTPYSETILLARHFDQITQFLSVHSIAD